MTADVKQRIDAIPGKEGYWKSSTRDAFNRFAQRLLSLNMTEDEVVDFLTGIYRAVSQEYGN